jgi:hypothetical protein
MPHSEIESRCAWRPIISPADSLAKPAWEAAGAIIEAVFRKEYILPTTRKETPGFEASLLFLFWGLGRGEPIWVERAVNELNSAIDNAGLWTHILGLHGGLCGLGWVADYVSKLLAAETEVHTDLDRGEDPNIEIDEFMLKTLDCAEWRDAYDTIGGLVGYGVYFLERLPRETAVQALTLIVRHLDALSECTSNGIGWHSRPEFLAPALREECPDGYYNLGAAHGIAGIIYLLGELLATGIEPHKSQTLLDGAFEWLLAHQRPPGSVSRFSSWIAAGRSFDSQLAWCYGDLGIMAVLIRAAQRTSRRDWVQFAHDLLDHCLAWPLERSGVEDAGLCHGACGIAHIFNRLYHSEGDSRCRDASLKWFERAIGMWRPGTGVGGFVTPIRLNPKRDFAEEANPDLLDGSIGVALALLAALTPVEPQWDRLLLLSGHNWVDPQAARQGPRVFDSDVTHVERRTS